MMKKRPLLLHLLFPSFIQNMHLFFFLLFSFQVSNAVRIQQDDSAALQELRVNFNEPEWLSSWNETDCDRISYVGCTADGFVSSIGILGASDIEPANGFLGDSIGFLSKLQNLTVTYQNLTGPLPPALCSLTSLAYLNLQHNSISGTVASCFDQLTTLTHLDLGVNSQLTGVIPKCVGDLSSLQMLSLWDTPLTGAIPDDLCRLGALRSLGLGMTLTGPIPSCLGDLPDLHFIQLNGNKLEGPIPESLCNLTKLQLLGLAGNFLGGALPPNFSNPALELYVRDNYFSGSAAVTFADGSSLCPGTYSENCLDFLDKCNDTAPSAQRTKAACSSHCNTTTSAAEACSGHGQCMSGYACACNDGFVPAYDKGVISCVADGNVSRGLGRSDPLVEKLGEQFARPIALDDILAATGDFSQENLLGKGGYGSVYLGHRDDGRAWAVKRATVASKDTVAVFEDEVVLISKINHRNLVQLLGFCTENDEQILVYEFVPCGTLQARLQMAPGKHSCSSSLLHASCQKRR
eukprot:jgi/Mesen1/1277/ME000013S00774